MIRDFQAFLLALCCGFDYSYAGLFGWLAYVIYVVRLIYWWIPISLPGRTYFWEFVIDVICFSLCVLCVLLWAIYAASYGGVIFINGLGVSFQKIGCIEVILIL